MELFRVYVCICIYLASQVCGRPLGVQDMCWRLRGTQYKLCLEEDNDTMLMSAKLNPISVLRQIFSYPLASGKAAMRKDDPDFSFSERQKLFSDKKDSSEESYIEKRPFDSISYNTGLGGFK